MRIDIVSIFPEYFDVLAVSLLGKARSQGLLDVQAHDLRQWTSDRHRTVDDTPYGGGAGMVMRPEPWGEAFDAILGSDPEAHHDEAVESATAAAPAVQSGDQAPVVVFPSPAGERFTQATARELAREQRLVFACGRYEGIDHRVIEEASTRARVREISLGDYVLNGGEVATLAMIEAIARLIPGVIGNPESLTEESHEDGLLEYPSYTKPATWRGRPVPPVLLSGNHAAIAAWRREQQLERTRRVRPDLLSD
jgi:tRNA (guanine37-N1)-methyltransferase